MRAQERRDRKANGSQRSRDSNGRPRDAVFTDDAWRRGWGDYRDHMERIERDTYRGDPWKHYGTSMDTAKRDKEARRRRKNEYEVGYRSTDEYSDKGAGMGSVSEDELEDELSAYRK